VHSIQSTVETYTVCSRRSDLGIDNKEDHAVVIHEEHGYLAIVVTAPPKQGETCVTLVSWLK
jgi:uncharacterized protein YggU (UPF0235/DUF167 family)